MKFRLAILVLCLAAVCSCGTVEPEFYQGPFDSVTLFYADAYNNLSNGITSTEPSSNSDLLDLCSGKIPGKKDHNALLAFCHSTASYLNYSTPNSPVLIRIYKDDEDKAVLDTVKVYPTSTVSASASTLNSVLSTVKSSFESEHYGMIYSSHGTGWLPNNYYAHNNPAPAPTSVGSQFDKSSSYSYEIELTDFASALPYKLDYIIFDACLMGGVEVAYELKDKCGKLVFSPAEIFTEGMYYKNIAERLCCSSPDLESVCKDYMEHYESGATISLVDCSKLDAVATAVKALVTEYGSGLQSLDASKVQKFYTGNHPWYYDLRDIFFEAADSEDELADLDKALSAAVLYKNYTPEYGQGTSYYIKISTCCGMSMFLPGQNQSALFSHYKTLSWNTATGLVK